MLTLSPAIKVFFVGMAIKLQQNVKFMNNWLTEQISFDNWNKSRCQVWMQCSLKFPVYTETIALSDTHYDTLMISHVTDLQTLGHGVTTHSLY